MKYAVRMDYDQPIWFCNGKEELYDSEEDAIQALEQEAQACERACQLGYMEDAGDFECYRIVEVEDAIA